MAEVKIDEYTLKARVFPSFLALLPLGVFLGQFMDMRSALIGACSGLGGSALFSFALSQWSRDAGKRRERDLWKRWGGPPTTRYLRHATATDNPILKEQRRRKLNKLAPDLIFPTACAEAVNPQEADWQYEVATKVLIGKTRDRNQFEILFQENVAYGFRRNLWALKPFGVVFCVVGIIGSILLKFAGYNLGYNMVAAALCALSLLLWLVTINSDWVRSAADIYADRLFASVDNLDSFD